MAKGQRLCAKPQLWALWQGRQQKKKDRLAMQNTRFAQQNADLLI